MKLDAEDPDFVDDVQEVERAFKAELAAGRAGSANIAIAAVGGSLSWNVDNVGGRGPCEKTGTGAFTGNSLSTSIKSGTYELWFTRTTVRLLLFSGGRQVDKFEGVGAQKGLSNRNNKPWTGTWG